MITENADYQNLFARVERKEHKVSLSVSIKKSNKEWVKEKCKKWGITPSQVIEHLIDLNTSHKDADYHNLCNIEDLKKDDKLFNAYKWGYKEAYEKFEKEKKEFVKKKHWIKRKPEFCFCMGDPIWRSLCQECKEFKGSDNIGYAKDFPKQDKGVKDE